MRIAFAGVSHWHSGLHLNAARFASAEIIGVWDANPLAANQFSSQSGIAAFAELRALIGQGPDLVIVMGRPDMVLPVAAAVFEARLPMILEKPAALSAKDLAPLIDRARREGLFVAVPLPNRMSPIWPEMARLAAAGRLGPISHAHFRIVNGPPDRYRMDGVPWVLDPSVGAGGALRNLGIHGIDAALAVGPEVKLVSACVSHRLYGEAVEDYAAVTLESADGMIVTVEAGYTYASIAPGGDFEWRVSARNAHLIDRGDECRVATLDDGERRDLKPLLPSERYNVFLADTLDRLARGALPSVGIAEYGHAMALIDQAYAEAGL